MIGRITLENPSILQGHSLEKEISLDCILCMKKKNHGGGAGFLTKHRRLLEAKYWMMVAVFPTTWLVNLQVLECCKVDGWIDGFTRLGTLS